MFFLFSVHHSTFPHPKIKHLVIPVRSLHPMEGNKGEGACGEKTQKC